MIAFARKALDTAAPLAGGSHADAAGYRLRGGALEVALKDGSVTGLADPAQPARLSRRAPRRPRRCCSRRHGLHLEIVIDREHPIGRTDAAGVADVVVEGGGQHHPSTWRTRSPPSTRRTRSRSIATAWPLAKGELSARFDKGGRTMERTAGGRPASTWPPTARRSPCAGAASCSCATSGHLMTNRRDPDARRRGGPGGADGQGSSPP
ncbi:MAG: hypothetical protein WDM92_00360 [Caulobacteraceae bacterium]